MADNPFGNIDLAITGYGVDIVEANLRHCREMNVLNPIEQTSIPLVSKKKLKIPPFPLSDSSSDSKQSNDSKHIRRSSSEKLQKLVDTSLKPINTSRPIATSLGWTKAIPKHEAAVSPRFTPPLQQSVPAPSKTETTPISPAVKSKKRLKRSGTFTVSHLTDKLSGKRSPTLSRKRDNL